MPRIRQYEDKYMNEDFVREVRARTGYFNMKQYDLAEAIGICQGSVSNYLRDPERIGIKELRSLVKVLKLSPETVLRFLGYSTKEINTWKERKP